MRRNDKVVFLLGKKTKNTVLPYQKRQAEHEPPIPLLYKNANTILCKHKEFRLTYELICSFLIQHY